VGEANIGSTPNREEVMNFIDCEIIRENQLIDFCASKTKEVFIVNPARLNILNHIKILLSQPQEGMSEQKLKNEIDKVFYYDFHYHSDLVGGITQGQLIIIRDLIASALSQRLALPSKKTKEE
jgi:hypothetical protein